ncbi:MAG TPA: M24 family metallopeptidase, partial [Bacteroidales bacterium]|nr:M24 family metallopeptidase [Bacteroidales bacterium]
MLYIKTDEEVGLLRKSNMLVSKTLAEVASFIRPGITTLYLDGIAESYIRDNGGIPAFKGYGGFPATLCTSVNEEIVHGIPSGYVLREGDIISVDC